VASPEVEKVTGASTSAPHEIFHGYYLPLQMDNAPPINLPTNGKYPFPIAPVTVGVSSEEDMFGKIVILKFMDHDITYAQKILDLVREKYIHTRSFPGIGPILLEPNEWVVEQLRGGVNHLLLCLNYYSHFKLFTEHSMTIIMMQISKQ
jgi:hypothetical protein